MKTRSLKFQKMTMHFVRFGLVLLTTSACTPVPTTSSLGDTLTKARVLNAQGVAAKDPTDAKQLFLRAVTEDQLYGPAQNNLGIVYLREGDFYHAAQAFDSAIKLMPQDPEPRTNLGLVFEAAGRYRNAQKQLEEVLVIAPDHLPAIQALARVRIRIGNIDDVVIQYLRTIVLRGTDEAWRSWARKELGKRDTGTE